MTEFMKEYIQSVRMCSYLIEPPASEVLGNLCDHIERLQKRVDELEEQQRWVPANEFIAKVGGVYYFEDLRGELLLGYLQPKDKLYAQLEHYAKRVFTMPLPPPPESEEE